MPQELTLMQLAQLSAHLVHGDEPKEYCPAGQSAHAPLLRPFPVWHEVQVVFELQERQVEGQLVQGLV